MIGHDYDRVEVVAFAVVVEAVLEDCVSGFWSEWDAIGFAECDEDGSACFLVVGEHAAVFVFSVESWVGHWNFLGKVKVRKIKSKVKGKIKSKVKGVGQECPTHTGEKRAGTMFCARCSLESYWQGGPASEVKVLLSENQPLTAVEGAPKNQEKKTNSCKWYP